MTVALLFSLNLVKTMLGRLKIILRLLNVDVDSARGGKLYTRVNGLVSLILAVQTKAISREGTRSIMIRCVVLLQ